MPSSAHPERRGGRRAAFAAPRLAPLPWLLCIACYSSAAVEGLPCTDDEACGPEHVCALGYCRAELDDALADCGDRALATGEWCYPLSRRFSLPLGDAALRDVAFGDLNGDGLDDALTVSDVATVLHTNLGGAFNPDPLDVRLTPTSLEPFELPGPVAELTLPILGRRLAVADFVGSSLPDVVFTMELNVEVPDELASLRDAVEARLWIVENLGDAISDPMAIPSTDPLGNAEIPEDGLRAGDFDGDGRDDLLVVTTEGEGATHRWLRGSPQGLLPPQLLPLSGSGPIEIADVDEDGLDDIVLLHRGLGLVSWLPGPLDAAEPARFDLGGSTVAMTVTALDDQPGLDLATLGLDLETRAVLSWTGDGFAEGTSREGPSVFDLAAGDLDGDGVADLVTVGADGIAVHSGFSGPQLGAAFTIVDEPAATIEVRHLDDDAAPDLVVTDARRVVVRLANP